MRPGTIIRFSVLATALLIACSGSGQATDTPDAQTLYKTHCASCHGVDRLGGQGPALIPENLKRLRKKRAAGVIAKGRAATQMPAFGEKLPEQAISALVRHIFTPLRKVPNWGPAEIQKSRIINAAPPDITKPVFKADPRNLFVVVESGDHHITILDGDRFEPIHRFKSRFALHGGPKFTSDGRYVFFASRDGWITKYDLWSLTVLAEVRAGINTRNIAVSSDGRYVMVANYLPHTLVLLDARDLSVIKVIPVTDGKGHTSRVSAVYTAHPRQSFIAALKDIREVWEISYKDDPPYYGWVHDYRIEGPPEAPEKFPVRRIKLDDYLDDFFFDQSYRHLIGAARNAKNGVVVNLIVGRNITNLDLTGLPHLGSGITWAYGDTTVLATPNLKAGEISIIDMKTWKTIKRLKTLGPGFFMRSHENSRYAWVDVFFGPHRDAMHVIDKTSLEIVKTLRPAPGKTAAHVEFDRSGRHALVSIWDMKGALVVYDADTLEEVKRIPMVKPSGKYNVHNKITLSEGTSH